MSLEDAKKFAKRLMDDRQLYDEMAAKEGEFWSAIQTVPGRNERLEAARNAATELGVRRGDISLLGYVRETELRFSNGLVLGCGEGRGEREWLKQGFCDHFHGIDISEKSIRLAQEKASDLPLTYSVGDLNFIELPKNEYDLVIASTCLHHVLHLEHLVEQIWSSMKSEGVLWVHDYIGDTQFQWHPKRKKITDDLLSLLPDKLKYDCINERPYPGLTPRVVGELGSPFESIRSAEIPGILRNYFRFERFVEQDALLWGLTGNATLPGFTENEDTRTIFELLRYFERILTSENVLTPMGGKYICRKRSAPLKQGG